MTERDISGGPLHDVIIVGAGYAGLSAALELVDERLDVLVLEAAGRPGGRTLTEHRPEAGPVDHGGQWVGPTQTELLAMAARFGCATFPTYDAGDHLERWESSVHRAPTRGTSDAPGQIGYAAFVERVTALAASVDTEAPWRTADAARLDSVTVESELDGLDDAAAARVRLAVQGVWAVEPRDLSMLHLAFYVASAGGWDQLMLTLDHAQDSRFTDGAQGPALAAADWLGDRVRLSAPVRSVTWSDSGAVVETTDGPISAGAVIVALPPPAARSVAFEPPLPYARRRWLERSVMGDVAKVHVTYERAFWRDLGDSGQASLFTDSPVGVVFDNSPDAAEVGVLVAFVYGDRLRTWAQLDDADRRAAIVATLVDLHGPRAAHPVDYVEKNWTTDRWIGGAYAATPAPGAWIEHGEHGWREPTGPIHWAGTEVADVWNGYIDGAIRSGRRAARAVVAQLRDR
ncbi:FAD-dependent oxidoreductase [Aeromicrobium sp.]|uniref:flavin monoamine oxidase family protein n=1 Tax=Aeromicrobium sp. TaxID=1871063 RepID=UPI0028B0298F|nr:FAD-dependent oxidoreductase [Aeromicrobium sp.]